MSSTTTHDPSTGAVEDMNLVEFWLRRDPTRWTAGVVAGLFAGAVSMAFAMVLAKASGYGFAFPAKLMGTIALGPVATETGVHFGAVLTGLVIYEAICVFFGFAFSHFVFTNSLSSLLAMGLVWAAYSWIFVWCLFMQSIKSILWAQIPQSAVLPICVMYGLSLSSVAFFDRVLRGRN